MGGPPPWGGGPAPPPTLAPQTRTLNSYAPWHDVNEISNENALMAYLTPKTCRTYSFPPY